MLISIIATVLGFFLMFTGFFYKLITKKEMCSRSWGEWADFLTRFFGLIIMAFGASSALAISDKHDRELNASVCDVSYIENGVLMEAKGLSSNNIYLSHTTGGIYLKGYYAKPTNLKITCEKKEI